MVERGITPGVLVGLSGVIVMLIFTLIADGDLDFGQRDAPQYYAAGLSLSAGQGLNVPFGEPGGPLNLESPMAPFHFYPPGLPFALALVLQTGLEPMTAVVILQAVFVGLLGWLLAGQVWRATESASRSGLAAVLGWSAGFFLADQFLSEALYLVLIVSAIGFLARYAEGRQRYLLALAALLATGATLVRVIGVSSIVVAWTAILLAGRRPKRAINEFVLVAAAILVPASVWVFGVQSASPASVGGIGWHPFGLTDLKVAVSSLSVWLAPIQLPLFPRVGLAVLVAGISAFCWIKYWRKPSISGESVLSVLFVVYALAHSVVVLVSMSVANAQIKPDFRQLAPAGLAIAIALLIRIPMSRRSSLLLVPVIAAAVGLGATGVANLATDSGYTEQPWKSSEAIRFANATPTQFILSNSPEGIWLNTGRSTYAVPTSINPWQVTRNRNLLEELDLVRDLALREDVVVVYFHTIGSRGYLVGPESFLDLGFEVGQEFEDATVLVERLEK